MAKKRIGEIMVDHGYVQENQVDEALNIQKRQGGQRLLGQILVGRGHAKPTQVKIALARQKEQDKD